MEEMTLLDTAKASLGTHLQTIEDGMECESPEPHALQDNGEDKLVFGRRMRFGRREVSIHGKLIKFYSIAASTEYG